MIIISQFNDPLATCDRPRGFLYYNPYIISFLIECNPIGSVILYIVPLQ